LFFFLGNYSNNNNNNNNKSTMRGQGTTNEARTFSSIVRKLWEQSTK